VDFVPKIKIEVIVPAELVSQAVDGKIFVSSLEEVTRIRTGESGREAI
jgi:nitrogen regulatory protein PII